MKIAILNGSPKVGNTAAMVEAFKEGAEAAGHEVEVLHVGKMKIAGCLGCEYCHGIAVRVCEKRSRCTIRKRTGRNTRRKKGICIKA